MFLVKGRSPAGNMKEGFLMKRIAALLMVLLLAALAVSSSLAEDVRTDQAGVYGYVVQGDGSARIVSFRVEKLVGSIFKDYDLVIPESFGKYPVTVLDDLSFRSNTYEYNRHLFSLR